MKIKIKSEDKEFLKIIYDKILCRADSRRLDDKLIQELMSLYTAYGLKIGVIFEYNEVESEKEQQSMFDRWQNEGIRTSSGFILEYGDEPLRYVHTMKMRVDEGIQETLKAGCEMLLGKD